MELAPGQSWIVPSRNTVQRRINALPMWWKGEDGTRYWQHLLKTRVTLLTLAGFLLSLWSLSFYASRQLQENMQRLLGEHQTSMVSALAVDINSDLGDRLSALEQVAARFTPQTLGNAASMRNFLEDRPALGQMFTARCSRHRSNC
jgi:hypothetical protein